VSIANRNLKAGQVLQAQGQGFLAATVRAVYLEDDASVTVEGVLEAALRKPASVAPTTVRSR
jgi:hypothetical protein